MRRFIDVIVFGAHRRWCISLQPLENQKQFPLHFLVDEGGIHFTKHTHAGRIHFSAISIGGLAFPIHECHIRTKFRKTVCSRDFQGTLPFGSLSFTTVMYPCCTHTLAHPYAPDLLATVWPSELFFLHFL